MTTIMTKEGRLMKALAEEIAHGFPFYDEPTRNRLGREEADRMILPIVNALERAGLILEEAREVLK